MRALGIVGAMFALGGCVSVGVDSSRLHPAHFEAVFRDLPAAPDSFETISANPSPDWRRLEGWGLSGVRIEAFDRVSGHYGDLATWAELSVAGRRVSVACDRRMYGPPQFQPMLDDDDEDPWIDDLSVSTCFVGEDVLVLYGWSPWGFRAGYWLGAEETVQLIAHRAATENGLAFNPERVVMYDESGAAYAYADVNGARVDSRASASLRELVPLVAAAMQIAQLHLSSNVVPGIGVSPPGLEAFEELQARHQKFVTGGLPIEPSDSAVKRIAAVGLHETAGRVAQVRAELAERHETFRHWAGERNLRFEAGLRTFIGVPTWDAWRPAGDDAGAVSGGFTIQMGAVIAERLRLSVGPMVFIAPTDSDDVPALAGASANGGGFGLDMNANLRLADWDTLDAFFVGGAARWTFIGGIDIVGGAARDFDVFAVGPTLGYEACAASETRSNLCLLTELAVMRTWISGTEVTDDDTLGTLGAAAQEGVGWVVELRLGLSFAL